jgi:hypothetical protein
MLLTGFPAAFVRSPDCTTWRSLRATNQTFYFINGGPEERADDKNLQRMWSAQQTIKIGA